MSDDLQDNYNKENDPYAPLIENMLIYKDSFGRDFPNQLTIEYYRGEWTAQLYAPNGCPLYSASGMPTMYEALRTLFIQASTRFTWMKIDKAKEEQ